MELYQKLLDSEPQSENGTEYVKKIFNKYYKHLCFVIGKNLRKQVCRGSCFNSSI